MLGRNGFFDPEKVFVQYREDGLIEIQIYSRRLGPKHAAIEIRGDQGSVYDLLQRISYTVARAVKDQGNLYVIPTGTPKTEIPDGEKKMRVIRTQTKGKG